MTGLLGARTSYRLLSFSAVIVTMLSMVGSTAAASDRLTQIPGRQPITLGKDVVVSGPGCTGKTPDGQDRKVHVALSPEELVLALIFEGFEITATRALESSRAYCSIHVPLTVADGFRLEVSDSTLYGEVNLLKEDVAVVNASLEYLGFQAPEVVSISRTFRDEHRGQLFNLAGSIKNPLVPCKKRDLVVRISVNAHLDLGRDPGNDGRRRYLDIRDFSNSVQKPALTTSLRADPCTAN